MILETELKSEVQAAIAHQGSLLKYAYLGGGSISWDKLRGSASFAVGGREIGALKLISEKSAKEFPKGSPLQLVHIGSGNGIEIPIFLKMFHLGKSDSYVAVDISSELLGLVRERQGVSLNSILGSVSYLVADVEKSQSLSAALAGCPKAAGAIPIIVASGEGTLLSNFAVLRHFQECLGESGYLMFSLDGMDSSRLDEVCEEYNQSGVRDFLINGVNFAFAAGAIASKEGEFLPAYYDQDLSQLIVKYRLADGCELVLLRSWKPQSRAALKKVLSQNGLAGLQIEELDGAYGVTAVSL